ncbi:MAG: recombination protein O N-terminal domain-containing protein [bacterium]|nr:recombination protein O N-terminal domain-containing protein [bacterium]
MPISRIVSALVFTRKNSGEADRIVTFFTKEEGLIRVIAKGVRKIPSARGGHLEPCTRVSVALHESRARISGEVGIYAGKIETEEYFHTLREDADAFSRACGHIRLFHTLFEAGQAAPDIFDALLQAWRVYPTLSHARRIVMDASLSLRMIHHAGIVPDMRSWNTNTTKDTSRAVIKYLTEYPSHASRISLSEEDANFLQRGMKDLLTKTLMVYS